MSPLVRSMMTPVRRAKPSDSEIGTQIMERTLQTPLAPPSLTETTKFLYF